MHLVSFGGLLCYEYLANTFVIVFILVCTIERMKLSL